MHTDCVDSMSVTFEKDGCLPINYELPSPMLMLARRVIGLMTSRIKMWRAKKDERNGKRERVETMAAPEIFICGEDYSPSGLETEVSKCGPGAKPR